MAKSGKLKEIEKRDPVNLVSATSKLLDIIKPEKIYPHPVVKNETVTLGWLINYRHQQLNFEPNYSGDKKLFALNDDMIAAQAIPEGCIKTQLAVQDIPSMKVQQSPLVYQLTWPERGFLELHETLISLRDKPGKDTTPIREQVESLTKELASAESVLSEQVLDMVPAELCYNLKSKIDKMIDGIESPGQSAENNKIEKMCTAMFEVGNELYGIAVFQAGGSWNLPPPVKALDNCVKKINSDVDGKMESIFRFKSRCQEIVNQHPLKMYGNKSPWIEKYFRGAMVLGFEPPAFDFSHDVNGDL